MISKSAKVDLHLHTNHSDGYHSPIEVVDKAIWRGIETIAITDHDDVSALPLAIDYGLSKGVEVLPGIELSVRYKGLDVHILAYCFDFKNNNLSRYLMVFKKQRFKRAQKIVERLGELDIHIEFEDVVKVAGSGTVGRPHIANLLLAKNLVGSFQEAFDKYLGDGKPANVEKYSIDLQSAISMIRSAGGICSIAHPGIQLQNSDILDLIKYGVQGIEVIHPRHSPEKVRQYRALVETYQLVETGGSDFHGGEKGENALGNYTITYQSVTEIKKRTNFENREINN